MVMCFGAIDLIKLIPFLALNLSNRDSVVVGLVLLPMAVIAALSGV